MPHLDARELETERQVILKDDLNLEAYWERRNVQMVLDRDRINLVPPEQKTDKVRWISNDPKVFFDLAQSLISLSPPRFRLPIDINYKEKEKNSMNKAERLCIGIHRALNARQSDTGGTLWLRDLAYWVLLGWYAVFAWVSKEGKEVKFRADIWDPMTVYPQWDSDGLIRCVRAFEVDSITAISMASDMKARIGLELPFKEPSEDSKPKVINWWRKRMEGNKPIIENAIMISGQIVKPITVQSKLTHIPIHVGAIGSPDKISPFWEKRRGEAITTANDSMYDYDNIIFSLHADILASQAFPNLVSKTRSGQPAVHAEDVRGHGTVIPLRTEDQLDLLRNAVTPADAEVLSQYIANQKNKGSVPPAVFGNIPVELSGFAISQLLASVRYKLGPHLTALQSVTSKVYSDFLFQYKNGRFPPITLSTENPQDLQRGKTYVEEYSQDDVPEHIYVEVTIPITSEFDKTQTILNSVQALSAGLLSRETLWEQDLNIQDTDVERERIRNDKVENEEFVLQMEIIEGMWAKVDDLLAKKPPKLAQAEALKQHIMTLELNLGIRQGIPVKPNQPGIPPNQMPPEARESPDARNAARGIPPPRPNRPVDEGRRGVLVSPSGDTLL